MVSLPLSIIFNLSLSSGTVPAAWKKSIVIPVFKSGDAKLPTNYRPISLTSIVCKVMEGIIKKAIVSYCYANDLLSDNQFAFLPKKSTGLQLLKYHDFIVF